MSTHITKETLASLKEQYPPCARVLLLKMDDPYIKLKPGDTGSVLGVDDAGTVHVKWDCGSTLGVVYSVDSCIRIDK